ncbi:MAG: mechanosensitive ion channel [Planctomycetes bacterium]|nr:mechanosensitive ion channel [Planctomycetota bacterium]
METYEQRRLQQAELHKRSAQQMEAIGQLRQRIEEAKKSLETLGETRSQMTPEQRKERATGFKKQADEILKEADTLLEAAKAEEKEIEPLQQLLPGIDALETALRDRLDQAGDLDDYRRLSDHFRRMKHQYDTKRQQIDLVVLRRENIVYAKIRQATLTRELADLYVQCAEVLVPPVPSFWDRHRKIIHSIGILGVVIAASSAVRLLIWLIRRALNALTNRRLSVKRIGTLLSFAGSILKVFIWVFGAVAILNEFGIEPSKSTGPIALVGLIMAGMFQQIVIDFVKGLDIIAGRHYNVGDFVELDGKHGHVVDFNVKYIRIRSLSGQEFNIPNSRCVPSRRFPDGFVSNYVDITLKSSADEDRAKIAIGAVCVDLNQRIEPVRDEPVMAQCFRGPRDSVTLRYRVRVLPGCDWGVRDHFIPAVKEAMVKEGVELAGEPTFSFINRIATFRKLFSPRLSEAEIVREVEQSQSDPVADEDEAQQPTPGPHRG